MIVFEIIRIRVTAPLRYTMVAKLITSCKKAEGMGKVGSICHFPVLCMLAFGDAALKSLFLLALGAH